MATSRHTRVIPLLDQRAYAITPPSTVKHLGSPSGLPSWVEDTQGRVLRDLRISVTDRCNFRCSYCMPKEVFDKDYPYLPHSDLLSFEEITRLAQQFVAQGVQKIRLTGGEPLLRKNIEFLIERLAKLRTPDGAPLDLTLTTNGALLGQKARALKEAGLRRITVSLDALDDGVFRRMNDVNFPVGDVLRGIETAQAAGLGPIKINMVVKRGTNEAQIIPMARHFRGSGMVLRFIEYMDVGATNGWRMEEVLPSAGVQRLLEQEFRLISLPSKVVGETAQRWGYAALDGSHDADAGEIGLISSVTQAFCGDCNRARLSTEGQLFLCLFASRGHDLRSLLRNGSTDVELQSAIRGIWEQRADRYSALRGSETSPPGDTGRRIEMSYIGG